MAMDDIDSGDMTYSDPECPECDNPHGGQHHHRRSTWTSFVASSAAVHRRATSHTGPPIE
jgi:hypothetical protein